MCTHTHTHPHTHSHAYAQGKCRRMGCSRGLPWCGHLQNPTLSLTILRHLSEGEGQAQLQTSSSLPSKRKQSSMLSHFPLGWALPGGLSHTQVPEREGAAPHDTSACSGRRVAAGGFKDHRKPDHGC